MSDEHSATTMEIPNLPLDEAHALVCERHASAMSSLQRVQVRLDEALEEINTLKNALELRLKAHDEEIAKLKAEHKEQIATIRENHAKSADMLMNDMQALKSAHERELKKAMRTRPATTEGETNDEATRSEG